MSIALHKGQRISLEKQGSRLHCLWVGVTWDGGERRRLLGIRNRATAFAADASIGIYSAAGRLSDLVYFGKLQSNCRAIRHIGEQTGGADNKMFVVDLDGLNGDAHQLVFVLNAACLASPGIAYTRLQLYDGTLDRAGEMLATYEMRNDSGIAGSSFVIGKLRRNGAGWSFSTIGEPTADRDLKQTLTTVAERYL